MREARVSFSNISKSEQRQLLFASGVFLILNVRSWGFPVFWDSILHARLSIWLYETGFSTLAVPVDIDALHPPLFNLYIAGLWKIFGKSLWITHAAILPFSLGIVWQVFLLVRRISGPSRFLVWGIILLEPCLIAQSVQMSPDICLVFFYLLALNTLLSGRAGWAIAGTCMMAMFHFRGVMMVPAICVTFVLMHPPQSLKEWSRSLLPFLPSAVLTMAWLIYHYQYAGWFFQPPMETYGTTRSLATFAEIIRNLAVMVFRFLDNGKVAIMLFILFAAPFLRKKNSAVRSGIQFWMKVILPPVIILGLAFIPFSIPLGHRYFLIAFLGIMGLCGFLLNEIRTENPGRILSVLLPLILLSGHFWVYPDRISKGWDSMLAHIPWYKLRADAIAYIRSEKIDIHSVCSDFPNVEEIRFSDLNEDGQKFRSKAEGWEGCDFVLWSNILNGFSDSELTELNENWDKEKLWGGFPVRVILFRKRFFLSGKGNMTDHKNPIP